MDIINFVNKAFSLLTIAGQIFIVLVIIYLLFFKKKYSFIYDYLGKHGLIFAFLVSFIATFGSLFYSQFVGFPPCDLCWFQRIFMYPEVILLFIALVKKDYKAINYILPLSVIGFFISLYHNYMNYGGVNAYCQILNIGVSCVKRYVFEFGYVTIPTMTLTAFSLIIVFLLLQKKTNNN